MLNAEALTKLRELAGQVCERESCELYDLEWTGHGGGRVLRVYIDRKDGRVSVDDCANVSRGLNLLLDVEDVIPGGAYELEISSPGLERRLTQAWHFDRAVGQRVRLRLSEALAAPAGSTVPGPRNVEGALVSATSESLVVKTKQQEWNVPRSVIHSGQVVFEEPNKTPPGKQKKGR